MIRRHYPLIFIILFSCCLWSVEAVNIEEIHVEQRGITSISKASILAHISVKVNDTFSRAAISRDIKTLDKTGRFSYVGAEVEEIGNGIAITYIVESKFRVNQINIVGGKEFKNKKALETLEIKKGALIDEATIAVAVQKLKAVYQEKYFPDVEISWFFDEGPSEGSVDVLINVTEGTRASVRHITFGGKQPISSHTLRNAMQQRKWGLWSWITKAGVYKPDVLKDDAYILQTLYKNKGHLDVKVGKPRIEQVRKNKLDIIMPIKPGPVYHIRDIDIKGATLFPIKDVSNNIGIKSGNLASLEQIYRAVQTIRDFYGRRGYIQTRVKPDFGVDLKQSKIDITFNIKEGKLAYIRDIHIRGNSVTKDKVIRRELAVGPGDIFNEVKVRRSERRVKGLGYFSSVINKPELTSDPDTYDLAVEVEEQGTGQFSVGFGFSSIDDLIGYTEISQGNFDIASGWPFRGGGQKLKLRLQVGTKSRDIDLTFVEPWFLDRKLSFEVNVFQRDRRFLSDDYDQQNTGGRISIGRPVGRYNRLKTKYSLEEIDVLNVDDNASDLIKAEAGSRIKSAGTLQFIHDSRDHVFISTRGNRTTLTGQLAGGPFGGETDLYRLEARSSHYWPLWFDHVFNIRGWTAVVDEYGSSGRVPIFDRFFLGGYRTLRGFKFRDVSPKDERGEPIGGKTAGYLTAEYIIPVAKRIRALTYYDVGLVQEKAYDINLNNINSDYGIGIRLDIPGYPIGLDYAWPIETDLFNDRSSGRFNFHLGYAY
ncbi:MAG: outer membrane protein assembly factor BamA [Kiritimatiellae bacterium]|nr:outer membrane protein assembly factor BamA [Kiritimatiellia bacterium]